MYKNGFGNKKIYSISILTFKDFAVLLHTERSVYFVMETTKDYIIEKAYHLFLSKSYDGVTVTDICSAIGMSKGALYHHFENKNVLFKAVIDNYIGVGKLKLRKHASTLLEYIEFKIETATKLVQRVSENNYVPLNYISLLIDAMRNYPEIQNAKEQIFYFELEEIKSVLQLAINSGEIRKDINVDATALNLLTITFGIAANLIRNNSRESSIVAYDNQLKEFYRLLKPMV